MDKHIRFAFTGAGSNAGLSVYEEMGTVAVQNNEKNDGPLYESMDGESAL